MLLLVTVCYCAQVASTWMLCVCTCGPPSLSSSLCLLVCYCAQVASTWMPCVCTCGPPSLSSSLCLLVCYCAQVASTWMPCVCTCGPPPLSSSLCSPSSPLSCSATLSPLPRQPSYPVRPEPSLFGSHRPPSFTLYNKNHCFYF